MRVQDKVYPVELIVGHPDSSTPEAKEGPCLGIFQKKIARDIFPITQMCYLNFIEKIPNQADVKNENERHDDEIEVNVRDEHPIHLILENGKLSELVPLIDGYYRMTGRFTASLCSNFQAPSILAMKRRKIHGPIEATIALQKLQEWKSHQVGPIGFSLLRWRRGARNNRCMLQRYSCRFRDVSW